MRSFSNFKWGIPFTDFLELVLDRWSKETWLNLLCHNQEFSLKAFKHVALQSKFNISIIYALFSRNLERMQVSVLPSKILQAESSKITLKPQSQSWLILKRSCLRPSTKTTFSINRDEPTLMLPIPIMLPFESSPKVTVSPSWYLDRVAKLLMSQVMCLEQTLSRYHRSLGLGALVCTYIK